MDDPIVVTWPGDLEQIVEVVHDAFFDLDDVIAQVGSTRTMRFFQGPSSKSQEVGLLTINDVLRVDYVDRERIGFYDLNEFAWSEGCLKVLTGVPLDLTFFVQSLYLVLTMPTNDR